MPAKEYIIIRGHGAVSPLGHNSATIAAAYKSGIPAFRVEEINGIATALGALPAEAEAVLGLLASEKKAYQALDRSVLMAIHAGRQAVAAAGWAKETGVAINIGSSRGATGLFEKYHQEFSSSGTLPAHVSPVTTLGNISSWVAQDLKVFGPSLSHSVTCSTGIQAIANGFAWLKSGMAKKFIAGAAEAPLTPFTVAQMKAIGIYTADAQAKYPCRPLNTERQNTFVLGEGAALFALEKVTEEEFNALDANPIVIESIGFGFETITSKTGISKEGLHFRMAMLDAIQNAANTDPIDLVIMHAPGTMAGDAAEMQALNSVFSGKNLPAITSTKWPVGHTLGASACISMEYAQHILEAQSYFPFPYPTIIKASSTKIIKRILITAAGFGGNAAALIISKFS